MRRFFEGGTYLKIRRHKQCHLVETSTVTIKEEYFVVSIRLLRKKVVALAVPTKFTAFKTLTELPSIVRILDGRAVKHNNLNCLKRLFQSCIVVLFLVIRNSSNKRRIQSAALIRGRRLLIFLSQMRRLFEGGAYSGAALIRVNTV